ncbi:hypothetical protein [Aliikangiella marina]|nr:hypothetical protein [Aliikangiella marina]
MTGYYEWNPMPHIVDIHCPNCLESAKFEFAEVVKIKLKKDVAFFKESNLFDYKLLVDSSGQRWHAAIYYPGLHGGSTLAIQGLPEGYKSSDWDHSRFLRQNRQPLLGSMSCKNCSQATKHLLRWPDEAYYTIEFKGSVLWAYHRESLIELRDFILSADRKEENYKWRNFLRHVPTTFKKQNARETVAKRLNRLINN